MGKNITSYSNTGLAASTKYYYQIKAVTPWGKFAYSNEETYATTLEASDKESNGVCIIATAENNSLSPALVVIALIWVGTLGAGWFFGKNQS